MNPIGKRRTKRKRPGAVAREPAWEKAYRAGQAADAVSYNCDADGKRAPSVPVES